MIHGDVINIPGAGGPFYGSSWYSEVYTADAEL